MPIPKPQSGETQSEFISRCIEFLSDEGTPNDQAAAICYNQWRDKMDDSFLWEPERDNQFSHTSILKERQVDQVWGDYPELDGDPLPETDSRPELWDDEF